jgi:hypothetical protein
LVLESAAAARRFRSASASAPGRVAARGADRPLRAAGLIRADASLVEIGLDVAGPASFGAGRLISGTLEETFDATRTAAAARKDAADAVREAESAGSATDRYAAQHLGYGAEARALTKGNIAAQRVMYAPSADVGFWRALWAGSREDAHYFNDTRNLPAEFSEDAAVKWAAAGLNRLSIAGKANWIAATPVDVNDKAAEFVLGLHTTSATAGGRNTSSAAKEFSEEVICAWPNEDGDSTDGSAVWSGRIRGVIQTFPRSNSSVSSDVRPRAVSARVWMRSPTRLWWSSTGPGRQASRPWCSTCLTEVPTRS